MSSRNPNYLPEDSYWLQKGGVVEFGETSVTFDDGTTQDIDAVIFCTGYQGFRELPFLDSSCDVRVNEMYMTPLYKCIIHVDHPSLMFNGFFDLHTAVNLMDCMGMYLSRVVHGYIKLPSKETMLMEIEATFQKYRERGEPLSSFHCIGGERQVNYIADLCKTGGFEYKKYPFMILFHLLKRVIGEKDFKHYRNDRFKITGNDGFEVY